jgi:hypothetical protein
MHLLSRHSDTVILNRYFNKLINNRRTNGNSTLGYEYLIAFEITQYRSHFILIGHHI